MDSLVGFRFRPTNEEIINLLTTKRSDPDFSVPTIKEIDFYSCEPWDLPRHSEIQSEEQVWYFFCEPYYKYAKSKRAHRRTGDGYWKITGSGSTIKAKKGHDVIGSKKILSFYRYGIVPKDGKSEWVMHEYHLKDKDSPLYKKDFVVCRVERKRDNQHAISTSDEGQQLVSDSKNYVTDNIFLKSQLPPSQNLAPDKSCGSKNIFSALDDYNVLNNTTFSVQKPQIYPEQESSSNGSSNGSDILNSGFGIEKVDDPINLQKAFQSECSCEEIGQSFTPDFISSKSDGGDYMEDNSGLDNDSFPIKQSQFYPEQESSYSNCSSVDCDIQNSKFNSRRASQNEYSSEETGQTLIPDFNSSRSDGGVHAEDFSDMDTETFNAWVNELFAT